MSDLTKIILMSILLILAFWWGPIFTLWSINLLFHTAVPVTVQTWAAVAWLELVLGAAFKSAAGKSN